jgi:SAM-dependent methyltransferase
MEKLQELLNRILDRDVVQGVVSNPRIKGDILKIKFRPIEKKGSLYFQLESFTKTQVFHENLTPEDTAVRIMEFMINYKQMQVNTRTTKYNILVSKKGKVTIQCKQQNESLDIPDLSHNRSKKYILPEGTAVPFLVDLGIMNSDGIVVKSRFDKFRQINRFLEFIEDILPQLTKEKELTILDFGCGKSYLTFAMYYYLHELKNYDIRIIGLDLKKDVISKCNELAVKYDYDKLRFLVGDVADYDGVQSIDMMVTLHACDTATDYALAKAIAWNAQVILSVPCCQHELNNQIVNDVLAPIMDYGLLKERFSSLVTDGLRAKYLEACGYETQVLEFIDMEHTPKNILLRAVKSGERSKSAKQQIEKCQSFLQADPALSRLLDLESEDK